MAERLTDEELDRLEGVLVARSWREEITWAEVSSLVHEVRLLREHYLAEHVAPEPVITEEGDRDEG